VKAHVVTNTSVVQLPMFTLTPLGILSGNIPCSQAQRTHSCTAISWCSVELSLKTFWYTYIHTVLQPFGTQRQDIYLIHSHNLLINIVQHPKILTRYFGEKISTSIYLQFLAIIFLLNMYENKQLIM
jgi:hypothetical protein